MSNEFVMVPRDLMEGVWPLADDSQRDEIRAILDNQLEHQGEPVALGPLCFCGLRQTKNPHPEAGVPPGYLEVGTVWDCIPCLNKSRRAWCKRANKAERELADLRAQLAERDALLREKSGDLIRMAAHLISAPLFALQDLQDEDKKMTRARVDMAVDTADARLKDAAYELRRIADALSASAEPSAPVDATHYYPKAEPGRQWRKKVGGLWCEFCGGKWLPLDEQGMSHGYVAIEPSAPVEHDHDALVAAVCVLRSQGLGNLSEAVEAARAALERKPS